RLDQRDSAVVDRGDYSAIIPGDPDASEIIVRMLTDDESMRMPPLETHKEVTPEEIALLKRWIAEGAEYEPHWSFRPLKRPALPDQTATRSLHPIDQFVAARLAEQGLTPSPAADERTLLRRLYLDLLGVPPREAEIEAY